MIEGKGKRIFAGVLAGCMVGGVALAMLPVQRTAKPVAKVTPAAKVAPKATPTPVPSPIVPAATTEPAPVAEAAQSYVVKSVLTIPKPLRQGDFYWNEAAAPATGAMVITVDLAAQTVSAFRDGHEIGTDVIVYGSDETPTPLGIFPITQKDAKHVSNIYGTPMPYMLRMTNDGISIHGSQVGDGYVTHGCVGVPTAFAKKLFGAVKLGDRIIVTRGEMLDVGQPIKAA